jgi:hypothetical protein
MVVFSSSYMCKCRYSLNRLIIIILFVIFQELDTDEVEGEVPAVEQQQDDQGQGSSSSEPGSSLPVATATGSQRGRSRGRARLPKPLPKKILTLDILRDTLKDVGNDPILQLASFSIQDVLMSVNGK